VCETAVNVTEDAAELCRHVLKVFTGHGHN